MKIRTDFVTNSSSSSFILAFESKDKVIYSLMEEATEGRLETLVHDILGNDAEVKTKEEALKYYEDSIYYHVKQDVEEKLEREKGLKWADFCEWSKAHADVIEKRTAEEIKKKVKELKESLEGKDYIVVVDYSDDCDGDLEHDIVPYLKSCMKTISHH